MADTTAKTTLADPIPIGNLNFDQPNKSYTFDVSDVVPMTARKIYIMSYTRSGNEINAQVNIKLWTRNPCSMVCHYHHKKFHRYPQNAISYDSETFGLPIYHDRKIYAITDHCQITNCHNTQLFVVGWKI